MRDKLPSNYCRCADVDCPVAKRCLRHICDNTNDRTPFTLSFRLTEINNDCDYFIEVVD